MLHHRKVLKQKWQEKEATKKKKQRLVIEGKKISRQQRSSVPLERIEDALYIFTSYKNVLNLSLMIFVSHNYSKLSECLATAVAIL